MAKKVAKLVKLQVLAGKATPAPPVGPALGQAGVNIMAFVKEFNERTAKQAGLIIPVEITVFEELMAASLALKYSWLEGRFSRLENLSCRTCS